MLYEQGKGNIQENHKAAEYWLKQSAASGYIKAQNRLKDYHKDKV